MNKEIDEKIDALAEEWGSFYVAYYPYWKKDDDIDVCKVRNCTDEGLMLGEVKKSASANTFTEAVDKAMEEYINE